MPTNGKQLYEQLLKGNITEDQLTDKGKKKINDYKISIGAVSKDNPYKSSPKIPPNMHINGDGFDIIMSDEPFHINKKKSMFDKAKEGLSKVPSFLSNHKREPSYNKTHFPQGDSAIKNKIKNIDFSSIQREPSYNKTHFPQGEKPKLHAPIPENKLNLNTGEDFNLANALRNLQRPIPESKTNLNTDRDFNLHPSIPKGKLDLNTGGDFNFHPSIPKGKLDLNTGNFDGLNFNRTIPEAKLKLNADEAQDLHLMDRAMHSWKDYTNATELTNDTFFNMPNRLDETKKDLENFEKTHPWVMERPTGNSFQDLINRGMVGVAEQSALFGQSALEYVKKGLPAGLGALALGQLGPQAALPEEGLTFPVAFNTVGSIGATKKMFDIEFAGTYQELLREGVDPKVAQEYAMVVGLFNAGLEKFGMDKLINTIPGAKESLKHIGTKGFKEVGEKFLKGSGKSAIKEFGSYMVAETGQEVAQESISMTGEHFAKKKQFGDKYKFDPKAGKQRLIDTAVESALTFGLMGVPGHTMQYANNKAGELEKLDKAVDALKREIQTDPKIKKGSEFTQKTHILKSAIDKNLELPNLTEEEFNKMTLIKSKVDELILDDSIKAAEVGGKEIKEDAEVVEKVNKPNKDTRNWYKKGQMVGFKNDDGSIVPYTVSEVSHASNRVMLESKEFNDVFDTSMDNIRPLSDDETKTHTQALKQFESEKGTNTLPNQENSLESKQSENKDLSKRPLIKPESVINFKIGDKEYKDQEIMEVKDGKVRLYPFNKPKGKKELEWWVDADEIKDEAIVDYRRYDHTFTREEAIEDIANNGSSFEGGEERIKNIVNSNMKQQEKIKALAKEFGDGARTAANFRANQEHSKKGITYTVKDNEDFSKRSKHKFTYAEVLKIFEDKYKAQDEKGLEAKQNEVEEGTKEAMAQEKPEVSNVDIDNLKPGDKLDLEKYGKVTVKEIDGSMIKFENEYGNTVPIGKGKVKELIKNTNKSEVAAEKPNKSDNKNVKYEDYEKDIFGYIASLDYDMEIKEGDKYDFGNGHGVEVTNIDKTEKNSYVEYNYVRAGEVFEKEKQEVKSFVRYLKHHIGKLGLQLDSKYKLNDKTLDITIHPLYSSNTFRVNYYVKKDGKVIGSNSKDIKEFADLLLEKNETELLGEEEKLTIDKRVEIEESLDTKKDNELIHPNSTITHETLSDNRFNSSMNKMLKDKVGDIPAQDLSLLNQEFTHRLISTGKAMEDIANEVVNEYKKNGNSMFKELLEAKQSVMQEKNKPVEKTIKPLFKDGELEFGIKENIVDEASKRTSKVTNEVVEGTKRGLEYTLDLSKYIAATKEQTIENIEDFKWEVKRKLDKLLDEHYKTKYDTDEAYEKIEKKVDVYSLLFMKLGQLQKEIKESEDYKKINTTLVIDTTDNTSEYLTDEEIRLQNEEKYILAQARIKRYEISLEKIKEELKEEKESKNRKTYISKIEQKIRAKKGVIETEKKHRPKLEKVIPEGMSRKEYKKSIEPRIEATFRKLGFETLENQSINYTQEESQNVEKERLLGNSDENINNNQEISKLTLRDYGMAISKDKSEKGTTYYDVIGETYLYRENIKSVKVDGKKARPIGKGEFFKWRFYTNTDPTNALLEALPPIRVIEEVKSTEQETTFNTNETITIKAKDKPDLILNVGDILKFEIGTRKIKSIEDDEIHYEHDPKQPYINNDFKKSLESLYRKGLVEKTDKEEVEQEPKVKEVKQEPKKTKTKFKNKTTQMVSDNVDKVVDELKRQGHEVKSVRELEDGMLKGKLEAKSPYGKAFEKINIDKDGIIKDDNNIIEMIDMSNLSSENFKNVIEMYNQKNKENPDSMATMQIYVRLNEMIKRLLEHKYQIRDKKISAAIFKAIRDKKQMLEHGEIVVIIGHNKYDYEYKENDFDENSYIDYDKLKKVLGNETTETKEKTPTQEITDHVINKLENNEKFNSSELFKVAEEKLGKMSEGRLTPKDAYDYMELGVNQYLLNQNEIDLTTRDTEVVKENVKKLDEKINLLPTQTKRTQEQEKYQQFSTPPTIAYIANWLANIKNTDTVLEPSAGIGGLAVFSKAHGAKVIVNELSDRRYKILENMNFDRMFKENAEQIDNILPGDVKPSVVIMNPPFTSTIRMSQKSNEVAKKHLTQALERLEPGGRLVCITGRGMSQEATSFKKFWKDAKKDYNVRANVSIEGKNYKKYGTNFDIQLIVIDKNGATTNETITNKISDINQIIDLLEGVADDRNHKEVKQSVGKSSSQETTKKSGDNDSRGSVIHSTTNVVGDGSNRDTRSGQESGTSNRGNEIDNRRDDTSTETKGDNELSNTKSTDKSDSNEKPRTDTDSNISDRPNTSSLSNNGGIKVEKKKTKKKKKELTDAVYDDYEPQKLKIKGAKPHPGQLAQSSAMSAVEPPDPTYKPKLPKDVITDGKLSIAQLEAVVYAGQSHEQILPNGERKGFFIGDGTGVGKGREVSGIILDSFNQGQKKAVWISKNKLVFDNAKEDFGDVGGDTKKFTSISKYKNGQSIKEKEGVLFATYPTLASEQTVSGSGTLKAKEGVKTRLDTIVEWLGKDFDGVIAFDESHQMQSAISVKGKRGNKKPTAKALSGLELQRRLPKAKIVYVSATGASEVHNLAYAERLGLWGEGTPFANKEDFINKISEGGLASMELVARDMKAMGVYMARNLSYDGVEYDTLTHELTPDQTEIYDTMARGWQTVLQNLGEALKETMQEKSNKRGQVYGQFWGSQQRFYNQVLTSMQMPSVIKQMKEDLINGYSPVLQLVNTNEAIMNRKVAKAQEEERGLDDLDLTPRDILMQYLEKSFPTQQYEQYEDEDGNKRLRPVTDSKGNPVINKKAEKMKEDLLTDLGAMKVPEGPLEMILNTFGVDNVAEITGRSRRVVKIDGKTKLENRTENHTKADVESFMNDEKQILVFSEAGGTGKSYHSSLKCKNQRRRMHYLIQAGFKADSAVQGFGRTHRTNQANAPKFILVTTNLRGHKRFISTIARRLDQLGALTKGERKTGSQGLFKAKDNLENELARDSLQNFYKALASNRMPGLNISLFEKLGLESLISNGALTSDPSKLRDIPQFLNRILSLEGELQNKTFDAFSEILDHATEEAIENGTLDFGLENYTADKIKVDDEKVVRTDESGAETKYIALEVQNKNQKLTFRESSNPDNFFYKTLGFYKNEKSGNIRLVTEGHDRTLESGRVISNVKLYDQKNDATIIEKNKFNNSKWIKVEKEEAKELWDKALKQVPEYKTETKHFISGALLPIWDRLPKGHVRVMRVLTDDGQMFLGRLIPESQIDSTLRSLGAEREKGEINLKDTVNKILDEKYEAHFANKWKVIRRKVSGDYRLELIGNDAYKYMGELRKAGVFMERIQYETRFFIPTGDKAVEVLEKITKHRPIIDVVAPNEDIADKINRKKSSGKVGIVNNPKAFNGPVNPKPMEKFNCGNEEAQNAFDSSNGVKLKIGFKTKMKNFATKFWELSTRQFQHLPVIAEFAEASNILRELGCKKGVSVYEALKNLHGITLDQDPTRYYNFRWKVVLDNEKENYEKGLQLRFITDPKEFEKAHEKITKIVNEDPILKEALQTRKDIMKNVTDLYIGAMQSIGVDFSDKFDRESYFRQQIMEYAELKQMVKGTGKKLKTPIGAYTIQRKDTDKAYNTQYLEAEYEVMSQMIYDTMIARGLNKIIGKYDISTKLQKEVRKENDKVIKPMVKEFKNEIEKLLAEGKINAKDAEYQNKNARKIVKKRLEEAGKLITVDKLLREKYPEYKKMQLKEGHFFYKSRPITGQMVDEMLKDSGIEIDKHITDPKLKGAIKDILAELNKQNPILAIGGKNKEYIMKSELVDTLENFKKPMDLGPVLTPATNVTRYLMRKWKPWQLIQPRRYFKYNYRNLISDLEMCIYNPDSFKYATRAASEIIDVFFGGKMITGDLYEFYTRGGFDSLLSVQELNEVQHLKIFDNLYEQSESFKNAPKNVGGLVKKLLWDVPMQTTQAREAVLRYANYLSFLDQLEKGELKSHGASNMELINALSDNKDKAYNMADDLMGAYDKISVMGQEIRANAIPFWSYQEMNFKRYIQLFKNATSEDKHQNAIGKYGIVAFNIAKFYVAANIVRILTQTINYALHGDDEDKLPEYVQRIPHVIVGNDKHGDPIIISRLGNTQDFNEWLGLNGIFTHDMKDYLNGRKTIGEIVKDMGKSPINKLAGGLTPIAKLPLELSMGRSLFPDVFETRFLRDRLEHIAQSVGLENEYKAVFNKPDKGYKASWGKLFYETYNEDQGACFKFIDIKNKWLLDHGITPQDGSPSRKPKALAMYYLKQSVRYGDKKAFEKYLGEYIKYGGTLKGYEESVSYLDPLNGVKKEYQDDFINDLNYEEIELYESARAYYDDYLAKSSKTGIENNFSKLQRFKSLYTKANAAYKKEKANLTLSESEAKLAKEFKAIDHANRRINKSLNKIKQYKEDGDTKGVANHEEMIKEYINEIIQ